MIPRQETTSRLSMRQRPSFHWRTITFLIFIVLTMSNVRYTVSYAVLSHPTMILPKNTRISMIQATTAPRIKYDLGISSSSDGETTDGIAKATQYWVEHESVNEFPSPLKQKLLLHDEQSRRDTEHSPTTPYNPATNTVKIAAVSNDTKKKKKHPPLIPNRLTDDRVLRIVSRRPEGSSSSGNNNIVQVIVDPTMRSGHDFDINTAWIELLIHEQQMKHSSNHQTLEAIVVAAV